MMKKLKIDIYATLLLIIIIETIIEAGVQNFGTNLFRLIVITLTLIEIRNLINQLNKGL
jgi:hypothetical protein